MSKLQELNLETPRYSKVDEEGQIMIPAEFRCALGIELGSIITLHAKTNKIEITPLGRSSKSVRRQIDCWGMIRVPEEYLDIRPGDYVMLRCCPEKNHITIEPSAVVCDCCGEETGHFTQDPQVCDDCVSQVMEAAAKSKLSSRRRGRKPAQPYDAAIGSNGGVIRRVDELGRIVFPVELLRKMQIGKGDKLLFQLKEDKSILISKLYPGCVFCQETEGTVSFKGKHVCPRCLAGLKKRS